MEEAAMATYCIGDIHGEYEKYLDMLGIIDFSDEDTLFVIGDVIDRGHGGISILKDMMMRPNVIPIIGNHEYMAVSCLKFLLVNNIKALITYLALVNSFRIKQTEPKTFLKKYLINTWLFELFLGKKENAEKNDIISSIKAFMRDSKHGYDYINKLLVYHMLKIYGRFNEYIEFGTLKQEYNEIIISYLNYRNIKDALDFIKTNVLYGVDTVTEI